MNWVCPGTLQDRFWRVFMSEEGQDSGKPKILEFEPLVLGKVLKPIYPDDDLLGEMLSCPSGKKR